jgi:hypothetical protein
VVFLPQWNSDGNVLIAADQMTNTSTFSLQGTIFPLTVINPITDEYILSGTWNIDVKEGRVMTEIFALEDISSAYEKVANGNVRFKAVIHPSK